MGDLLTALAALAMSILATVGTYGSCADDMTALPADYHPDRYGYTLVCVDDHPVHPRHGLVQGYVNTRTRTITLWGDNTYPAGFVLAHEIGHLELGHTTTTPNAEPEATAWATNLLGGNE